ncbi:hypothetical protein [Kutzneria kofuensis]|uniref:hypothetical protein n=1 Tax=Kutzneria kofuensis TaxID=103725 RepID=UPI0031EF8F31
MQGAAVQARDIAGPVQQAEYIRNSPTYTAGGNMTVHTLRLTPKRVALVAVIVVAVLVAYMLGDNWYRIQTAVPNAEAQQNATKVVDSQGPPFTAQYLFDTKVPNLWTVALDRKLTPEELTGLEKIDGTDGQAVWNYLRPLGGRLINRAYHPPGLEEDGSVETFRLSLLSDRSTTLTIENISVSHVKCTPSTAVSLIEYPPHGNASVDGIGFNLRTPDKPLSQVNENGVVDHDYFAKHKIDLGAGATPGALLVTAVGEHGQSCSWDFTADYATADDQSTFTFDNHGKPLTLESAPDRPLQHILFGPFGRGPNNPMAWQDCAAPDASCG